MRWPQNVISRRPDGPRAFIQWKGTDVCADLLCECGARGHFDGTFMYHVKCALCCRVYDVGFYVELVPAAIEDVELCDPLCYEIKWEWADNEDHRDV